MPEFKILHLQKNLLSKVVMHKGSIIERVFFIHQRLYNYTNTHTVKSSIYQEFCCSIVLLITSNPQKNGAHRQIITPERAAVGSIAMAGIALIAAMWREV